MDAQAMTSFHLREDASLALQWLGAGALVEALYFLALHWNVRMLALGRSPLFAMALVLGRFVVLAACLASSPVGSAPCRCSWPLPAFSSYVRPRCDWES
jgi:N-ATPase, AtpR subunit